VLDSFSSHHDLGGYAVRSFGYTIINCSKRMVGVHSTDAEVLLMAKTQAKSIAPQCFCFTDEMPHRSHDLSGRLPNGEFYCESFSKLNGKEIGFGWWLIKALLSSGWEVFQVESSDWDSPLNPDDKMERTYLRIEYDKSSL
jgi:hypothetical protein